MSIVEKFKALPKKNKIIISSVTAAVIVALIVVGVLLGRGYYATTMRLLKIEGTVNIEDADGNSKPVIDNIRFSSGEALSTGSDGLASVGLDDTKIVTLESDSRVEFTKARNMLALNLTRGGLYFEVNEHLSDDETFDIRTSTMTVGIRGTSGYVFYDSEGRESLVITDGVVHVTARNPETGEVIESEVPAGCQCKVYLYDASRPEGSIEFFLEELEEDELPVFTLRMLAENPELLQRVCNDTGWSAEEILALAEALESGSYWTEETEPTEETSETSEPSEGDPDPTVTPTNTPTPIGTPTSTATPTPTPRPNATNSPTPTVTSTPVPTVTVTPTPTNTPTPDPQPQPGGETTPTPDPEPSPDPEPETEPTISPTPSTDPTEETDPSEEIDPYLDPETGAPYVPDEYTEYEQVIWGDEDAYGNTGKYIIEVWTDDNEEYLGYMGEGVWSPVYFSERRAEDGDHVIFGYFTDEDGDYSAAYFIQDIVG